MSLALTFTREVTPAGTNRSAGRACRIKIRIVPAYTWLCQFVQALLAISLVKIGQKARIIRHLLQKAGSDAFHTFFLIRVDKMCDLENSGLNDVSRPSLSPTNRWLFLSGALALPLAAIAANAEAAEAQAAKALPKLAKAI